MPRADRWALIACEGFRKQSANAIEFDGFAQHDEHSSQYKNGGVRMRPMYVECG
jgi:hypothetical protein